MRRYFMPSDEIDIDAVAHELHEMGWAFYIDNRHFLKSKVLHVGDQKVVVFAMRTANLRYNMCASLVKKKVSLHLDEQDDDDGGPPWEWKLRTAGLSQHVRVRLEWVLSPEMQELESVHAKDERVKECLDEHLFVRSDVPLCFSKYESYVADNVPVGLVPKKCHYCRLIGHIEGDTFVCAVYPLNVEDDNAAVFQEEEIEHRSDEAETKRESLAEVLSVKSPAIASEAHAVNLDCKTESKKRNISCIY